MPEPDPSKAELATICLGCATLFPAHWQAHNGDRLVCRCGVAWRFANALGWRLADHQSRRGQP